MAVKNMGYDHPSYLMRCGSNVGEVGGAATTQYGKFVAFTTLQAFSSQITVTTAGTAAGHGFQIAKISGTTTTALGTQTLGTAAAGSTYNLLLTNVAGGVSLAQGDLLVAISLADTVGKAAITHETQVLPLANVTA